MAGLGWMVVALVVLLTVGEQTAAVDQNQLKGLVTEILNRYQPSYAGNNNRRFPMFSVAVSIPYNNQRKMYDLSRVTDSSEAVRNTILKCDVYTGQRLVAATVLRWPNVLDQCPNERVQWEVSPRQCNNQKVATWADVKRKCYNAFRDGKADHAEYRTLTNFNNLVKELRNKNDLLLFFVLSSPCDKRCTSESSPLNILRSITRIQEWKDYAVVFSNVFQPRGNERIPEQELQGALKRLGAAQGPRGPIGLSNIFRCNRERCTSCSVGGEVARYCYSEDSRPQPGSAGGGQGVMGSGRESGRDSGLDIAMGRGRGNGRGNGRDNGRGNGRGNGRDNGRDNGRGNGRDNGRGNALGLGGDIAMGRGRGNGRGSALGRGRGYGRDYYWGK